VTDDLGHVTAVLQTILYMCCRQASLVEEKAMTWFVLSTDNVKYIGVHLPAGHHSVVVKYLGKLLRV